MPNKIKETQHEDLEHAQGRDKFLTPNYATKLLIPFIPKSISEVWECAAGELKITNVLKAHRYKVLSTDIRDIEEVTPYNFLTDFKRTDIYEYPTAIITNPPFSLKRKFYERCKEYRVPFALLIPADYSGWIIDSLRFDGAEKIIPTRRIDYITPNGLSGLSGHTSNFHSMWLTWGFGLGKSETFVELTNEMKKDV
jgi:hypothetical protein